LKIKLKIIFFFTLIVFVILTVVCLSIYYFAYENRENNFKTRLTNRAVTTARLLSQADIFNRSLLQKIDASTTVSMVDKSIQVYDTAANLIYVYSDKIADTIEVNREILINARKRNNSYFKTDKKDVVAYNYGEGDNRITIIAAAYDPEGRKNLDQLRFILWLSFFAGILITIGAGYYFSQGLLRPVRKIADEVNEITAQNLAKRIKTREQKDEWSYLATTLNILLNRLEESFQTQGRFIANASHELSTPLTSIFSQLEVSLQKDRDADAYRVVMQSVLEDVHNLNRLTQTLLQFASASGTSTGIDINLVRIDEILLRMPREMKKLNSEYQVKINFVDLPSNEEKLLVFGNEDLLFSAVKNIVVNACKYSDDHFALLELSTSQQKIFITITDTGKGISKEALPHIFQPFYRANENRGEPGFGLGLSLSSRIVKLHKGDITVNSIADKGTSFVILLPIALNEIVF